MWYFKNADSTMSSPIEITTPKPSPPQSPDKKTSDSIVPVYAEDTLLQNPDHQFVQELQEIHSTTDDEESTTSDVEPYKLEEVRDSTFEKKAEKKVELETFTHLLYKKPQLVTLKGIKEFISVGYEEMMNAFLERFKKTKDFIGMIVFIVDVIFLFLTFVKWIYLCLVESSTKYYGLLGYLCWFALLFSYRWKNYKQNYPGFFTSIVMHLADVTMNLMYLLPYYPKYSQLWWLSIPTIVHSFIVFNCVYYLHYILWEKHLYYKGLFHLKDASQILHEMKIRNQTRVKRKLKAFLWGKITVSLLLKYLEIIQGYYSFTADPRSVCIYFYLGFTVMNHLGIPIVFMISASRFFVSVGIEERLLQLKQTAKKSMFSCCIDLSSFRT